MRHVQLLAKLWGDDDLPQAGISRLLPIVQALRYIQLLSSFIKPGLSLGRPLRSAFPREISSMSLPLPRGPVPHVGNPNGATLPIGPDCALDPARATRRLPGVTVDDT